MVRTQHARRDRQHFVKESFSIRITSLFLQRERKEVLGPQRAGMIGPQCPFLERQSIATQLFCLRNAALIFQV